MLVIEQILVEYTSFIDHMQQVQFGGIWNCGTRCRLLNNVAQILPVYGHHSPRMSSPSSHQPLHHLPMHVGQPEVAALKPIDEPRVVDAEAVEGGGLEVVDVDGVFDDVVTVVV